MLQDTKSWSINADESRKAASQAPEMKASKNDDILLNRKWIWTNKESLDIDWKSAQETETTCIKTTQEKQLDCLEHSI